MKTSRILIAVVAAAAAIAANSSVAATTANLLLRGTVGTINEIYIAPNGNQPTNLDIINGEVFKNVASATEISNSATGYKIMMSSENGGFLVNTGTPSQTTIYQVAYDGGVATTPQATPTMVKNVGALASAFIHVSEIHVNVDAYPTALAGSYEDTLTLSIVAN